MDIPQVSDLTPPFQGLTGLAIGWAGWAGDGDGITGSGPPSRPGSSEPAFDAWRHGGTLRAIDSGKSSTPFRTEVDGIRVFGGRGTLGTYPADP